MSDLQELTCTHCGAALTGEAAIPGETIVCHHCGTPFRVPEARQIGGITLEEGSRLVVDDGNVVGGNMIVGGKVTHSETGQPDEANKTGGGIYIGRGAQITIMKGDVVGGDMIATTGNIFSAGKGSVVAIGGETAVSAGPATPPDLPTPTAPLITTPVPPPPSENLFQRWWRRLFK
ncbi:MAG: hypothetical protein HYZ49_16070 [Chloroflexi bacterium]|nr:hypothetical protein [Chloroflexota bacterium]